MISNPSDDTNADMRCSIYKIDPPRDPSDPSCPIYVTRPTSFTPNIQKATKRREPFTVRDPANTCRAGLPVDIQVQPPL